MHRHTALEKVTEKADKDADFLATEKYLHEVNCCGQSTGHSDTKQHNLINSLNTRQSCRKINGLATIVA